MAGIRLCSKCGDQSAADANQSGADYKNQSGADYKNQSGADHNHNEFKERQRREQRHTRERAAESPPSGSDVGDARGVKNKDGEAGASHDQDDDPAQTAPGDVDAIKAELKELAMFVSMALRMSAAESRKWIGDRFESAPKKVRDRRGYIRACVKQVNPDFTIPDEGWQFFCTKCQAVGTFECGEKYHERWSRETTFKLWGEE